MQITPASQETQVACLNGVKETEYKLSDEDLSVLQSHLLMLVSKKLRASEMQNSDNNKYDARLLQRLDYPAR